MTSSNFKMEVLAGPERRRRWSTAEKLAIIHETYEADATVSIVARRHGIQPNQLFAWRKLASQGALTATAAEEEVVPASEYRALQAQVKELQRLLGKKTILTFGGGDLIAVDNHQNVIQRWDNVVGHFFLW